MRPRTHSLLPILTHLLHSLRKPSPSIHPILPFLYPSLHKPNIRKNLTTSPTPTPRSCPGCGSQIQHVDPKEPGYLPLPRTTPPPKSIHSTNSDPNILTPTDIKRLLKKPYTKPPICQRCHNLLHHSTHKTTRTYPDPHKLLSTVRISPKGAILCIIDIADFPASFLKNISSLVGSSKPIILIANKIDLLPNGLDHQTVIQHVKKEIKQLNIPNIRKILLTSAKTGEGLFELCETVAPLQNQGNDVYFVGCANVGKSALLNAVGKLAGGENGMGVTTSILPGTTVDMVEIPVSFANLLSSDSEDHSTQPTHEGTEPGRIYDTPGLYNPTQITHILTPSELRLALPKSQIKPVQHSLRPGRTLFVGGLFRIDVEGTGGEVMLTFYGSNQLPLHICRTDRAEELYAKHGGGDESGKGKVKGKGMLMVPPLGKDRAAAFPDLEIAKGVVVGTGRKPVDIGLGGIGWVNVVCDVEEEMVLKVWSPGGSAVVLREGWMVKVGKKRKK